MAQPRFLGSKQLSTPHTHTRNTAQNLGPLTLSHSLSLFLRTPWDQLDPVHLFVCGVQCNDGQPCPLYSLHRVIGSLRTMQLIGMQPKKGWCLPPPLSLFAPHHGNFLVRTRPLHRASSFSVAEWYKPVAYMNMYPFIYSTRHGNEHLSLYISFSTLTGP